MAWDGNKQIGIKTCGSVSQQRSSKYIREEEEAQYKSKRSRGDFEDDTISPPSHKLRTPSTSTLCSGYGGTGTNIPLRRNNHIIFP